MFPYHTTKTYFLLKQLRFAICSFSKISPSSNERELGTNGVCLGSDVRRSIPESYESEATTLASFKYNGSLFSL